MSHKSGENNSNQNQVHDEVDPETAHVGARTHIHFSELFKIYKLNFGDWVICFLYDNCSVNQSISTLTKKPLVGCNNDKLNLEDRHLLSATPYMQAVINNVETIMHESKCKLRNAELPRNLTDLKPVLRNQALCSGICKLLNRFVILLHYILKKN